MAVFGQVVYEFAIKKLQFGSFMFKARLLTSKIWLLSVRVVLSVAGV